VTGPGPGSRRLGQTRSSNEYGRTRYTCTGRGSHDPPADPLRTVPGRVGQELRCPVCGLTKRIGYRARQRIAATGLTVVDISALPF
jgi:hypothetical protein